MKSFFMGLALSVTLLSVVEAQAFSQTKEKDAKIKEDEKGGIPAVRLINNADGTCSFERGILPTLKHLNTTTYWISNKTEEWEKNAHPAPRRQYVVTLKGKIKFKVTDGSTFIIEPGTILLAEDLKGKGHSWDMVHCHEWERLYIPIAENADDFFVPDTQK